MARKWESCREDSGNDVSCAPRKGWESGDNAALRWTPITGHRHLSGRETIAAIITGWGDNFWKKKTKLQEGSSTSASGMSKNGCRANSSGTRSRTSSGWRDPWCCRQRQIDRLSCKRKIKNHFILTHRNHPAIFTTISFRFLLTAVHSPGGSVSNWLASAGRTNWHRLWWPCDRHQASDVILLGFPH